MEKYEIQTDFGPVGNTVKLGNKEQFDKEQIGIKEPFPLTNENSCNTTTQEKFMILYWKWN